MRKNRREYPLPHYGQIVTTRHTIEETIWDYESDVCYNTAVLIALGRDDKNYMFRLYSICSKLCFISKLIFRSENGLKLIDRKSLYSIFDEYEDKTKAVMAKFDDYEEEIKARINEVLKTRKGFSKMPDKYYENIFISSLEYPFEAEDHLRKYNKKNDGHIEITSELLDHIIKCKTIIASICVHLMKRIDEQFFIGEYAYAFDYVMQKNGDLPMPEYGSTEYNMGKHQSFFPCNYEDFKTEEIYHKFEEFDTDLYWM